MKNILLCVISAAVLSSCGTTLINSQSNPKMSALTMYINLKPFVLDSVEITRLSDNQKFSNKRYGWGKEYFREGQKFRFLSIGNIPKGEYCLSRIYGWTVFDKNEKKSEFYVDLPKDLITFKINETEIFYLGDIEVIIFKSEESKANFVKLSKEISESEDKEKIIGKTFSSNLIGYNKAKDINKEFEFGLIYQNFPLQNYRNILRDGEREFLNFFAAQSDSQGWSIIARRRLDEISKRFK